MLNLDFIDRLISSNVFIGIMTCLISGFYSGMVITQYSAFCRNQVSLLDILRRFEWMVISDENFEKIIKITWNNYQEIANVGSTFLYLGHRNTGESSLKIYNEIAATLCAVKSKLNFQRLGQNILEKNAANISGKKVSERMVQWQERARQLKPYLITLFNPIPRRRIAECSKRCGVIFLKFFKNFFSINIL